jgi:hypothetical protein
VPCLEYCGRCSQTCCTKLIIGCYFTDRPYRLHIEAHVSESDLPRSLDSVGYHGRWRVWFCLVYWTSRQQERRHCVRVCSPRCQHTEPSVWHARCLPCVEGQLRHLKTLSGTFDKEEWRRPAVQVSRFAIIADMTSVAG